MDARLPSVIAAFGFLLASARPAAASPADVGVSTPEAKSTAAAAFPASDPHRLSVGVNYTGLQARWDLNRSWSGEVRVESGSANSMYGNVRATVPSFRAYRFFGLRHAWKPFLGAEAGYVFTDTKNSFGYEVTGPVLGAFAGMEWRWTRRLALGLSIGPYMLALKANDNQSGGPAQSPSLQFVADTYLLLRIF